MGKKATSYLLYNFLILLSFLFLLLAAAAARSAYVDPTVNTSYLFLGLTLPIILIINLILLIYWCARRKIWLILPLTAVLVNWGYLSAVYQFPGDKPSEQTADLKLATYNIHRFVHHDNVKMTVNLIADFFAQEQVDIVCFHEFVPPAKYNLDSIATAFDFLPHVLREGPGLAVFSRYPILDSRFIPFEGTDNSALQFDVDVNGKTVRMFTAHLQTTGVDPMKRTFMDGVKEGNMTGGTEVALKIKDIYKANTQMRARQAKQVRELIDASGEMPILVCGDFNDTPTSFTYRTMKGNLTDGFKSAGHGHGGTFSYMKYPLRIDYIFHSEQFSGARYYIPDVDYSDHRPVILEVNFK